MLRVLTALTLLVLATAAHAQSALAPSNWKNQRGSEMQLHWWNPINQDVGGIYINRAPGYPRCANTPYILNGKSDGTRISFTVNWTNPFDDCKSSTTWQGIIQGNTIRTRWVLTYQGGSKVGHDIFQRQ
jgi:hypothetical protein